MAGSRTHWFADSTLTEHTSALSGENLSRARVLRLKPGELITITNGLGILADCEITSVETQQISFTQRTLREVPQPPQRLITQALIKHDPVEDALRLATEFGATQFTPWQAQRSVLRWDPVRAEKQVNRLRTIAREQSLLNQIAWFPEVHEPVTELSKPVGLGLLLAGDAETQLSTLLNHGDATALLQTTPISIVVGPEGGMTETETDSAMILGYQPVSLGGVSYRSLSAAAAALALIAARTAAS